MTMTRQGLYLLAAFLLSTTVFKVSTARVIDDTPELTTKLRQLLTLSGTQSCNAPGDYAIVMDSSGSIGSTDYVKEKTAATIITQSLTNAANRFYVNQFGNNVDKSLMPSGWGNMGEAQLAIQSANFLNQGTNMVAGLQDAKDKFALPTTNTVKICFLITDGEPNTGGGKPDVNALATTMKSAGITIITIGVGSGVDATFLAQVASQPSFYFPVADMDELVKAVNGIIVRVCPMVCENESFSLIPGSTNVCALPLCTTTSGAICYDPYVSGALGSPVVYSPAGPLTVTAGTTQTFTVTASYGEQKCSGAITINCQSVQCKYNADCYKQLDPNVTCATPACEAGKCIYKPKYSGAYCDDENPCTKYDKCDGTNWGPNACKGTPKNCAYTSPPVPALKGCYAEPFCDENDGTCVWPFTNTALTSIISANAYCGTWAGAFATQLVNQGTTPNPSGSLAYSQCIGACSADICAKGSVPSCSCMAMATAYSRASAGTCPPCPPDAEAEGWCYPCSSGTYTDPADGSNPNATCWYPNPNVKTGEGGMLYPCNGRVFTEYSLTGGTATSQCMGCVAIGSAYNKNSSICYAGNISIPVDP